MFPDEPVSDQLTTPARGADLRRLVAVVPVRTLEGAKSRLGGSLDAEERQDLVRLLLSRTILAAGQVSAIESVVVVSPDPAILALATGDGATPIQQVGEGLNEERVQTDLAPLGGGSHATTQLPRNPADDLYAGLHRSSFGVSVVRA